MCEVFRLATCLALRKHGIDVSKWIARGGAHECEFAGNLINFRCAKWGIMFPNGNRLAKQQRLDDVSWLRDVAASVCASCSQFERSAVFVGHASLSPGVKHPEAYAHHVPKYQQALHDLGAAVVSDFSGALSSDGIHWAPAAYNAVAFVVDQMVQRAVSVARSSSAASTWWLYERTELGWYQAKCIACEKFVTAAHLDSKDHKMRVGSIFTGKEMFYLPGCESSTLLPCEIDERGTSVTLKPHTCNPVDNVPADVELPAETSLAPTHI